MFHWPKAKSLKLSLAVAGTVILGIMASQLNAQSQLKKYYLLALGNPTSTIRIASYAASNNLAVTGGGYSATLGQDSVAVTSTGFSEGAVLTGSGDFYAAGSGSASEMAVPDAWLGTDFIIPQYQGQHTYSLLSPTSSASVTLTVAGNTTSISLQAGVVVNQVVSSVSNGTVVRIQSDNPIVIAHRAELTQGSGNWIDRFPMMPAQSGTFLGINATSAVLIGARDNGTAITVTDSDGGSPVTYSLNAGEVQDIRVAVAGQTQGQGRALKVVSDKPVSVVGYGDGDGEDAVVYYPAAFQATHYVLPFAAQYLAIACAEDTAITVHQGTNASTSVCESDGTHPGKIYVGSATSGTNIAQGSIIESSKPVYIQAEESSQEAEVNTLGVDGSQVNIAAGATLNQDTVWHTDKTYVLAGVVTVGSGKTLTIEAGAKVLAASTGSRIDVSGILNVNGENYAPVLFQPSAGNTGNSWQGIRALSGGRININKANIQNASSGVSFLDGSLSSTLSESIVVATTYGVVITGSASPLVEHNDISGGSRCFNVTGGTSYTGKSTANIVHNQIGGCTNGIYVTAANNVVYDPQIVANFNNFEGFATGNAYRIATTAFANKGNHILDARNNWWGTAQSASQISAKIYDYFDNGNFAKVDFGAYATSQHGGEVPAGYYDGVLLAGSVTGSTELPSNSEIQIYDDVVFSNGASLEIGSGSQIQVAKEAGSILVDVGAELIIGHDALIEFESIGASGKDNKIEIKGRFVADGMNPETNTVDRIRFTSPQTSYLPATASTGNYYWGGIYVYPGADLVLAHVDVEYAKYGLYTINAPLSDAFIQDNTFKKNIYGNMIYGENSTSFYSGIYKENHFGVRVDGYEAASGIPAPTYFGNILRSNNYGVYVSAANSVNRDPAPVFEVCAIYENITSAYYLHNNFYNKSEVKLKANYVWWGYDTPSLIEGVITNDNNQALAGPYVDFSHYITGVTTGENGEIYGISAIFEPELLFGKYAEDIELAPNAAGDHVVLGDVQIKAGRTFRLLPGASISTYPRSGGDIGIEIAANAVLQMDRGSSARFFNQNDGIAVYGTLRTQGTQAELVTMAPEESQQPTGANGYWEGISVFYGATADIDYALVEKAKAGVSYYGGSAGHVRNSRLQFNVTGVAVDGASPEMKNNTIIATNAPSLSDIGIVVSGDAAFQTRPDILNNVFSDASQAVNISSMTGDSTIAPVIQDNEFHTTNSQAVKMAGTWLAPSATVIDARYNWWGTNSLQEIQARIYDYIDTAALPLVNYAGFILDPWQVPPDTFSDDFLLGSVSGNVSLIAGKRYYLSGPLVVQSGSELTIPAGTELYVTGNTKEGIEVNGTLRVQGTAANPVKFMTGKGHAASGSGDWQGITVNAGGELNVDHAYVEYAATGVKYKSGSAGQVSNSEFKSNSTAIKIEGNSSPGITNNNILGGSEGIWFYAVNNGQPGSYSSVAGNDIRNANIAIYISADSTAEYASMPHPDIQYNNLLASRSDGAIYVSSVGIKMNDGHPYILAAHHNWFGSSDPGTIHTRMYDWFDSRILVGAIVDYSEFALGELTAGSGFFLTGETLFGEISGNRVLEEGIQYTLLNDVIILSDASLTMEQGVQIAASNDIGIEVHGELDLYGQGELQEKVSFVHFLGDGADPSIYWDGISVKAGGNLQANNSVIQQAVVGVTFEDSSRGDLVNSIIRNNTAGVRFSGKTEYSEEYGAYQSAVGNLFVGNGNGIEILGSLSATGKPRPDISLNYIFDNAVGVLLGGAKLASNDPDPSVHFNAIYSNGSNVSLSSSSLSFFENCQVAEVSMTYNWWGAYDPKDISQLIDDQNDSLCTSGGYGRPFVDYSGFIISEPAGYQETLGYDIPVFEDVYFHDAPVLLGHISSNTTLAADTEYTLLSNILVDAGVTLTIPQGVVTVAPNFLDMSGAGWSFLVAGELDVNGTSSAPVVFTSFGSLWGARQAIGVKGPWGGIDVSGSGTLQLDHAVVENASEAVWFNNGASVTSEIKNSWLRNNAYGVYANASTILSVENSLIEENQIGMQFAGNSSSEPTAVVSENTIRANKHGIWADGYNGNDHDPVLTVNHNDILGNTNAGFVVRYYSGSNLINAQENWWGSSTPVSAVGTNCTKDVCLAVAGQSAYIDFSLPLSQPYNSASVLTAFSMSQYYISPNADTIQDQSTIAASFSASINWSLEISDASGAVVKSWTDTGTLLNQSWAGLDDQNILLPDGRYTVRLINATTQAELAYAAIIIDTVAPAIQWRSSLAGHVFTEKASVKLPIETISDVNLQSYSADRKLSTASNWTTLESGLSFPQYPDGKDVSWNLSTLSSGDYSLRLTAQDRAGNSTTQTISVILSFDMIAAVSGSSARLDLSQPQASWSTSFTLQDAGTVQVRIYRTSHKYGYTALLQEQTVRVLTNTYAQGGSYSIAWDGKDENGNVVPYDIYGYQVIASSGGNQWVYDATDETNVSAAGTCNKDSVFDPYKNDTFGMSCDLRNNYNLAAFSNANFRAILTFYQGQQRTYKDALFYIQNSSTDLNHTFKWNGLWDDGTPAAGVINLMLHDSNVYTNSILVTPGVFPVVDGGGSGLDIRSDPYLVTYSYDQFAHVDFRLDTSSFVTVKLLPQGVTDGNQPGAITVIDNELKAGGTLHSVEWSGHAPGAGQSNNFLFSKEGAYQYEISARSSTSNATSVVRGTVQLYQ